MAKDFSMFEKDFSEVNNLFKRISEKPKLTNQQVLKF